MRGGCVGVLWYGLVQWVGRCEQAAWGWCCCLLCCCAACRLLCCLSPAVLAVRPSVHSRTVLHCSCAAAGQACIACNVRPRQLVINNDDGSMIALQSRLGCNQRTARAIGLCLHCPRSQQQVQVHPPCSSCLLAFSRLSALVAAARSRALTSSTALDHGPRLRACGHTRACEAARRDGHAGVLGLLDGSISTEGGCTQIIK